MYFTTQKRWRMAYKFYEDQMRTSIPRSKASATPNFVEDPSVTTVDMRKFNKGFSSQFYHTDNIGQAAQFIQAGDLPKPPVVTEELTEYGTFLHACMARSSGLSLKPQKKEEDGPPEEITTEQKIAAAKAIERKARSLGSINQDVATTLSESDREVALEKLMKASSMESPSYGKLTDPELPDKEVMRSARDRMNKIAAPVFEETSGHTPSERRRNYEKAMEEWETNNIMSPELKGRNDFYRKRRQEGAPILDEWSTDNEATHNAGRSTFMNHYLSQPGWTPGNFSAMYSALKHGKQTPLVDANEMTGPTWQL